MSVSRAAESRLTRASGTASPLTTSTAARAGVVTIKPDGWRTRWAAGSSRTAMLNFRVTSARMPGPAGTMNAGGALAAAAGSLRSSSQARAAVWWLAIALGRSIWMAKAVIRCNAGGIRGDSGGGDVDPVGQPGDAPARGSGLQLRAAHPQRRDVRPRERHAGRIPGNRARHTPTLAAAHQLAEGSRQPVDYGGPQSAFCWPTHPTPTVASYSRQPPRPSERVVTRPLSTTPTADCGDVTEVSRRRYAAPQPPQPLVEGAPRRSCSDLGARVSKPRQRSLYWDAKQPGGDSSLSTLNLQRTGGIAARPLCWRRMCAQARGGWCERCPSWPQATLVQPPSGRDGGSTQTELMP